MQIPKRKVNTTAPGKTPAYTVGAWDASGEGEKSIIYADTGMGKTTLAALSPTPVFLGLDDGGRKIKHPVTGELLNRVENIGTFQDVRNVLQQVSIFDEFKTIVIDTVTILQDWAIPHMLKTILTEKGSRVENIVGYGYNKGYQHLYDLMKLIIQDCDQLVRNGKNIILVAQSIPNRISNPGGEDYLRDGPRLYAGKPSVEALYCEWADHILRINYQNVWVKKNDKKDRSGKVTGDTTRAIFVHPEVYFRAKSRTITEPVISFESPQDDSVWKFIHGDE